MRLPGEEGICMVVMSMIGLVAGLVLAGSAIIAPQPARYIVGVLLVALSAAVLFYRWRRRRAEKVGSRWRFRVRVGGVSAALAVLSVTSSGAVAMAGCSLARLASAEVSISVASTCAPASADCLAR